MSISGLFICSLIASFTILLNICLNLVKLCFMVIYMKIFIAIFLFEFVKPFSHQSRLIEGASDLAFPWVLYCLFTFFLFSLGLDVVHSCYSYLTHSIWNCALCWSLFPSIFGQGSQAGSMGTVWVRLSIDLIWEDFQR